MYSYQYPARAQKIARPMAIIEHVTKAGMNFFSSVRHCLEAVTRHQSHSIAPMLAASRSSQVICIPTISVWPGAKSSAMSGGRKRAFNSPAVPSNSLPDNFRRNADLGGPLANGKRLAEGLVTPVSASVKRLLKRRCPPAVLGAVRAVVIDAVERMRASWPLPHVLHEDHEIVSPFVADHDTPRSIEAEVGVLGVVTPVKHSAPCVVKRVAGPTMSRRQLPHVGGRFGAHMAATRKRIPASQIASDRSDRSPAVAGAVPCRAGAVELLRVKAFDDEASKSQAGQIKKTCHEGRITKLTRKYKLEGAKWR